MLFFVTDLSIILDYHNIQVSDKKQNFYQLCHLLTTITGTPFSIKDMFGC